MSPHTRHGRHAGPSHRRAARHEALAERRRSQAEVGAAAGEASQAVRHDGSAGLPRRGLIARLRSNWVLHGIYAYTKAYIPIFAMVVVLLGMLWLGQTFIPKAPTLGQRWDEIQGRHWTALQDARQASIDAFSDFDAQKAAFTDFRDATKAWMSDIRTVDDWGKAQANVEGLLATGDEQVALLDEFVAAPSAGDISYELQQAILSADQTFRQYLGLVRSDLDLKAEVVPTLSPVSPSPSASPGPSGSVSPQPSGSAPVSGSGSPQASPSPAPSGASPSAGPS